MLNFDLSYLSKPPLLSRLSDEDNTDASSMGADDTPNTSGASTGLQSGCEEAQSPPLPPKCLSSRRTSHGPVRHTSTPEVSANSPQIYILSTKIILIHLCWFWSFSTKAFQLNGKVTLYSANN